jgi:hypothetical protein
VLVESSNADQKQDDLHCLPKGGRLCDAQVEILDTGSRTANTPTIPSQKEYLYLHKSVQVNIQTVGIFGGLLGWFSMETVREYLDHEVHSSKRLKKPWSSFLARYHPAWWASAMTYTLRYQSIPYPCLSLSFQALLPPDAEIFICIRTGQLERLKRLFVEQRASVTDMMAPYCLSTTALAIIYNQTEIYRLLDSAGASRVSTMLHKSTRFKVGGSWSNYSTLDCSVSAEAIMDDHRYYTCCEFMAKTLSNAATQSCAERDSFTRLHRGTLKLTTECLETLLMDPSENINEVDSKGRTALHLATYLCDIQAVELLLRANASSEVRDYAGKSPL